MSIRGRSKLIKIQSYGFGNVSDFLPFDRSTIFLQRSDEVYQDAKR